MPATPAQTRLAAALPVLQTLQQQGITVYRSDVFTDPQRRALLTAGFLRLVIKGWYMAARPGAAPGDTTRWFASMRAFIAAYCESRFGDQWHISPGFSVQIHTGTMIIPQQVIVHAPNASNNVLALPGNCSLLCYKAPAFASDQIGVVDGLRVLRLPAALDRVPESFFRTAATDAQIALSLLPDASDLSRELLAGGHPKKAGVLAGALRSIGRADIADDIVGTMRAVGYAVVESNPFDDQPILLKRSRPASPYALRLELMWEQMRPAVLDCFGDPPGLPVDAEEYLRVSEDIYRTDAYHSLSIEGYRVTDDLIERVASGTWDPTAHAEDADARSALAAHGYWLAFQAVQMSLGRIIAGVSAGEVAASEHGAWYRALFSPSVAVGLMQPADLAGYRSGPVYIKNARHVPPSRDAVRDMMSTLFELLRLESHPAVRAVLGHFVFVFIHPYADGNGRIGRFLMNAMLASGGYDWTVIRVDRRDEYIAALNVASGDGDIRPFAAFIASSVAQSREVARMSAARTEPVPGSKTVQRA